MDVEGPGDLADGLPLIDEFAHERLLTHRNKHHAKADWPFTTDDARVKLKRLYPQL